RLSRFAAPSRQDRLARKSRHGLTAAAPTTPPEPPTAPAILRRRSRGIRWRCGSALTGLPCPKDQLVAFALPPYRSSSASARKPIFAPYVASKPEVAPVAALNHQPWPSY